MTDQNERVTLCTHWLRCSGAPELSARDSPLCSHLLVVSVLQRMWIVAWGIHVFVNLTAASRWCLNNGFIFLEKKYFVKLMKQNKILEESQEKFFFVPIIFVLYQVSSQRPTFIIFPPKYKTEMQLTSKTITLKWRWHIESLKATITFLFQTVMRKGKFRANIGLQPGLPGWSQCPLTSSVTLRKTQLTPSWILLDFGFG